MDGSMDDDVGVGWHGGEARLDYLLAEELEVDPAFAAWFAAPALLAVGLELEPSRLHGLRVRLHVWDRGGDGCDSHDEGENDLDAILDVSGEQARLLVENKLWAKFQPEQARRYRTRADSRHRCAAVLVAPRAYLDAQTDAVGTFHAAHAIEDVADRIESGGEGTGDQERRRWRAALLRSLARRPDRGASPPDHPPTVAFTAFCTQWLAEHAPGALPNPRMLHTEKQGWLWFSQPSGLAYKASHGFVDLYVEYHGFIGSVEDLQALVDDVGGPAEFVVATDTSGNTLLRWKGVAVAPSEGPPGDPADVVAALRACADATAWIAANPFGDGQPVVES